jgi:hypothetical protein
MFIRREINLRADAQDMPASALLHDEVILAGAFSPK